MSPLPAALSRLFSDLIKADTVIDGGELAKYASIRKRFGITAQAERQGAQATLAAAIQDIARQSETKRAEILKECISLSVSDGFCAYPEALLLLAFHCCLEHNGLRNSEAFSIALPDIRFEDNQVVFVESRYCDVTNEEIRQHYRDISNELRLVGFNFVYIPCVAEHYRHYKQTVFKDVATFLAPHLSENEIDSVVRNLSRITTADFCKDQLCLRFGMESLRSCQPSLLIKVSENYVGNKPFMNFLRVPVDENVLAAVRNIVDFLKSLINADSFVIPNIEDANEQFLYHGFYKQLFDMYTVRQGVASSLLVDFDEKEIQLQEVGIPIDHLRRKEKAFYVLLLAKSQEGGLNFNSPQTSEQLTEYQNRMRKIQGDYARIYALFGGDKSAAPDIENPEIRRPIVSNIRKRIAQLADILHQIQDYSIVKDKVGNYRIPLSAELIQVKINSKRKGIGSVLS